MLCGVRVVVQPLSLETSESSPYKDSIAISQDKMMQYSADEQIRFTFRSVRDDSSPNTFSGSAAYFLSRPTVTRCITPPRSLTIDRF